MIPPFPAFIFSILAFLFEYLNVLQSSSNPPPPFPVNALLAGIEEVINILQRVIPIHVLLQQNYNGNRYTIAQQCIWNERVVTPGHFWLQTGETPGSLLARVVERIRIDLISRVRDLWNPRRLLSFTNLQDSL